MARTTKNNILPTLALYGTLLFLSYTTTKAQFRPPLFVFGDSLLDSGMTLYNGVEAAGAEFWPYGQTYFGKPAGRYCDGRLISDFIAQYAGLPLNRPYLLPGINDFTQGVSFASAGACMLAETRPGTISLAEQMRYFVHMVQILKQQIGQFEAYKLLSSAVFLFNIGGNDYFSLFEENRGDLPLSSILKRDFMYQILGNYSAHLHTIHNQGGRKFAFFNIGPMGCMPSVKYMLHFDGPCAEEPQELARMHNVELTALLNRLRENLPGFTYTIYDFYNSLRTRVLYGRRFGFKESEIACCGSGPFNGGYTCQRMEHSFSVCSIPSDYLWFDAGHTTERANEQFAIEMWNGGPDIIAPYNLRALFSMTTQMI